MGVLAGLSLKVIFKRKEVNFIPEDDECHETDMLDKANLYLLQARNHVEEMVSEAEETSNTILEQTGKILSSAKDKTSSMHHESEESVSDGFKKIER